MTIDSFKNLKSRRFLIYALLLHAGVGLSFAIFDNGGEENNEKSKDRIIEIDISAPKPQDNSIEAETFSSDDLKEELANIENSSRDFNSNNKLKEAEIKEEQKELNALKKHAKNEKAKLAKEKKNLQKEKRNLENEKKRLKKEIEDLQAKK